MAHVIIEMRALISRKLRHIIESTPHEDYNAVALIFKIVVARFLDVFEEATN